MIIVGVAAWLVIGTAVALLVGRIFSLGDRPVPEVWDTRLVTGIPEQVDRSQAWDSLGFDDRPRSREAR